MSEALTSFRAIIGLWRSPGAMALEIGAPAANARKWEQRDRIPDEWWSALLATSTAQAAGLTAETLVELAARAPTSREAAEARP